MTDPRGGPPGGPPGGPAALAFWVVLLLAGCGGETAREDEARAAAADRSRASAHRTAVPLQASRDTTPADSSAEPEIDESAADAASDGTSTPADTAPENTPSDRDSAAGRERAGGADSTVEADSATGTVTADSGFSSEAAAVMRAALGLPPTDSAAGDSLRGADAPAASAADTLPRTVEALREAGPVYIDYDAGPRLVRDRRLQGLLEEHLVPVIEENALSVRTGTRFWVLVDSEGEVADAVIQTTSGSSAFDRAAAEVATRLRYEPARHDGEPAPVWVLVRVSLLMP